MNSTFITDLFYNVFTQIYVNRGAHEKKSFHNFLLYTPTSVRGKVWDRSCVLMPPFVSKMYCNWCSLLKFNNNATLAMPPNRTPAYSIWPCLVQAMAEEESKFHTCRVIYSIWPCLHVQGLHRGASPCCASDDHGQHQRKASKKNLLYLVI